MRPTCRPRQFAVYFLLALLLPAWAAGALPLVWCVGPNGHNAIETMGLNDCHDEPTVASIDAGVVAGKDCIDFSLWQRAEAPKKPVLVASVSNDPSKTPLGACEPILNYELVSAHIRQDAASDQLAQLRTVVLLI